MFLKNKKAYVSGALTALSPKKLAAQKKFYERIAGLRTRLGFRPYVPHKYTDPRKHPRLTAMDVYYKNKQQIASSGLMVADLSSPSFGVSAELEIANVSGTKTIALYYKGSGVSRMAKGNPSIVAEITYADYGDELKKIVRRAEENKRGSEE